MSVKANSTRLPTEPPYNTFTILCTTSVPDGVFVAKSIKWRRRIGSGTTGLTDVTANGDTILIDSSDLTLAVSTSRLTVTEDTAGDYRYRCRIDNFDLGIFETEDVYPINVVGMFLCSGLILAVRHVVLSHTQVQLPPPSQTSLLPVTSMTQPPSSGRYL